MKIDVHVSFCKSRKNAFDPRIFYLAFMVFLCVYVYDPCYKNSKTLPASIPVSHCTKMTYTLVLMNISVFKNFTRFLILLISKNLYIFFIEISNQS